MKHSIIKNFTGWQRIFEADAATPATPAPAAATTPAPAAGATLQALVAYPTTQIKSADGKLTANDAKAIQRILINGTYLLPKFKSDKTGQEKPSDDGVIGKRSVAAITQFRTVHGVSDTAAPAASRAGVTVGPATLAKFNEIIADPKKLIVATQPETQAAEETKLGEEEMAKLDAEKKAKDAAEKAKADAAIAAANDKANETVKQIMELITSQFGNKEFFKEFETGLFRKDNVAGAVTEFSKWFNATIAPLVNTLPEGNVNKTAFGPNGATLLGNLTSGITNKTNRLVVPYTDAAGKPAQIVVMADF